MSILKLRYSAQNRPPELRYRIADYINDRLKILPGFHAVAKAAIYTALGRKTAPPPAPAAPVADQPAATSKAKSEQAALVTETETEPALACVSLDSLPLPPMEMRKMIGTTDPADFGS